MASSKTQFGSTASPALAARVVVVALAALAATQPGCRTYEDTYSGTFREVTDESNRNGDAVAVDLFRFGDNASAIIRFYKRDPITGDPFGEQQFCVWTDTQPFDDDAQKFRVYINKSSSQLPRSQLFGDVLDDQNLEVSLYDEQSSEPYEGIDELHLSRHDDRPDTSCDVIEDFNAQISFPRDPTTGAIQTMPASAGYDIHNPVFMVSWLGLQQASGTTAYAPVNRHAPGVLLSGGFASNYDAARHGLKNDLFVAIPPPPEVVRMPSGNTTMALGHFTVIDDSEADRPDSGERDDWHFSWDTETEKVVASGLRRATRTECRPGTDHWGRALLFVEGSLQELSAQKKSEITLAGPASNIAACQRDEICDAHFYLVDICAGDDQVFSMTIDPTVTAGSAVPLFVTDEYLYDDSVPLPRTRPY